MPTANAEDREGHRRRSSHIGVRHVGVRRRHAPRYLGRMAPCSGRVRERDAAARTRGRTDGTTLDAAKVKQSNVWAHAWAHVWAHVYIYVYTRVYCVGVLRHGSARLLVDVLTSPSHAPAFLRPLAPRTFHTNQLRTSSSNSQTCFILDISQRVWPVVQPPPRLARSLSSLCISPREAFAPDDSSLFDSSVAVTAPCQTYSRPRILTNF